MKSVRKIRKREATVTSKSATLPKAVDPDNKWDSTPLHTHIHKRLQGASPRFRALREPNGCKHWLS